MFHFVSDCGYHSFPVSITITGDGFWIIIALNFIVLRSPFLMGLLIEGSLSNCENILIIAFSPFQDKYLSHLAQSYANYFSHSKIGLCSNGLIYAEQWRE